MSPPIGDGGCGGRAPTPEEARQIAVSLMRSTGSECFATNIRGLTLLFALPSAAEVAPASDQDIWIIWNAIVGQIELALSSAKAARDMHAVGGKSPS